MDVRIEVDDSTDELFGWVVWVDDIHPTLPSPCCVATGSYEPGWGDLALSFTGQDNCTDNIVPIWGY